MIECPETSTRVTRDTEVLGRYGTLKGQLSLEIYLKNYEHKAFVKFKNIFSRRTFLLHLSRLTTFLYFPTDPAPLNHYCCARINCRLHFHFPYISQTSGLLYPAYLGIRCWPTSMDPRWRVGRSSASWCWNISCHSRSSLFLIFYLEL